MEYMAVGLQTKYNNEEMMSKDASEKAADAVKALTDKIVIIS